MRIMSPLLSWSVENVNVLSPLPAYRRCTVAGFMSSQQPLDEWETTEKPEHQQFTVTISLFHLTHSTAKACI